ncbi:MAG: SDR family NAD(P)-dependent oxidoreductase [Ilumatobacteraceae bacterium]|jgi:dTDP-glucose 4,6-dehydratase|nr:SDR family NAD(P)-dependent oxidoreductase [Ilumatobacteraceae bacterium]MBJ7421412.1 SDR family NAD(P)-dependent oxidoreductase [Ilumatobacteraceae bacterium]
MKILVTGADGFIGSHVVETLVKSGHEVRAFVLYNSFNSWGWLDDSDKSVRESIDVFAGDIRDPHGVDNAVSGQEVILNLAALIAIPYSYHSPDTYIDTNIKGTLNILQAARRHEVSRVIQTSTSEVYGTAQYIPIDEKHPLHPQSPYAASKVGADQLALSFHASFKTPVGVLRPFNTYGPRQSARAVIPTIISQLATGREVKLGSLSPTRDFSFVQDTANGFLAAAMSDAIVGQTVNLGSGFEISIQETAETIAKLMNVELKLANDEQRVRPESSEVERLHASIQKAKEVLGWQPQLKGLEGFKAGLKQTIDWFSNPTNLARYKADRYNL